MEKLDSSKKNQENLEDSVMYYQKETKEVAELLQKGNVNIARKITRIPFYRLEKMKKIEEEKLKNIHKAEKKKEKDLTKIGKGHDYHQVERRRYKRTKKQKEQIQQNTIKETQNHKDKEKEKEIINKAKIINNKIESNEIDKEKKKTKLMPILTENKGNNKNNIQNNINLTEHKDNNNKINSLSRNYSDYYHDLKYAPSSINYTKKELRMSKKQQKIQFPEYTLSHFLSRDDKQTFNEMLYKKGNAQKKMNTIVETKNIKINANKEKSEIIKVLNNKQNKKKLEKINSEKKIIINNNKSLNKSLSLNKIEEIKEKINKSPSLENIKEEKNNITKEENDKELNKEISQKEHSKLKLLRKKHKRMNKYKKAILKFRLEKKKAFCNAVEKENERIFFSNTFNADESISNVINNVLNQNINADDTINNNTNINNDLNNISEISGNNNQDKTQINNETNLSHNSPILNQKKLDNNIQNNSILNYYSYNYEQHNNTFNSNNIYQNNNNSDYMNKTCNINPNNYFLSYLQNEANYNNISLPNNNYKYNKFNENSSQNIYINNNTYNYYYYPQFSFQNINGNYNYINNSNMTNSNYSNFNINNTLNNSLPLPKNAFNTEYPSVNLNFKKEKQKEKKLNSYIENLKEENKCLNSLNINTMNGKDLSSLIKENKNIDKINLSLINKLLPEEEANSFIKKYTGINECPKSTKKPIREYVDQILDKDFEEVFSNFIIKLRDIYYKKKSIAPLKAKKRIVLGMREIEKNIKLKNILLLFVVPYIEKVVEVKNSMDERILNIFENCRKNEIPIFFGLNKFKLGQIARKKISAISMLAIVNVEGMENELKNIIKIGNELKKKWYLENYENKDNFKDNKFIKQDNFEYFHNMNTIEEIKTNKDNLDNKK